MLDYIAQQVVALSFFDRRQGLKIADRLGRYDEVMGYLGQSLKSLDNLDALHSLLQKATGTGLDASRTAAQRFPGVFDKVKDAFRASDSQLQSKFKHTPYFRVDGNWNSVNRERFRQSLNQHVQGSETVIGRYMRPSPFSAFHHYNPSTGRVVVQKASTSEFVTGYTATPAQRGYLEDIGDLGGN